MVFENSSNMDVMYTFYTQVGVFMIVMAMGFILGLMYIFFTHIGVIMVGLTIGFVTVSMFVYRRNEELEYELEYEIEYEPELPYEQKYYSEFHDMDMCELSKSQLSELTLQFIHEQTPSGEVVMSYCDDTSTFQYWCDDKNIKFMVLDAVAQKFAIDNNVKAICIDYKKEYEDAVDAAKAAKEKKSEETETIATTNVASSVFAKFKSYNTASEKTKADVSKNKTVILTEKCNRFKRRGNVADWETEMKVDEELTALVAREPEMTITEWLAKRRTTYTTSIES